MWSRKHYFLNLSAGVANLLVGVCGITLTWPGNWINSYLLLGMVFGSPLGGIGMEKLGRKITLLSTGAVFIIALILKIIYEANPDESIFYAARILLGLAAGSSFVVVPNYICEISTESLRGQIVTSMFYNYSAGLFINYILIEAVSALVLASICLAIIIIFLIVFQIFMPETPVYLISKKMELKAQNVLVKLNETVFTKNEFSEISNIHDKYAELTWKSIYKDKYYRKALIITVTLGGFQSLSGIYMVWFEEPSINNILPINALYIILAGVQFIVSGVNLFIIKKNRRKLLLIISAVGMAISQLVLGIYYYIVVEQNKDVELAWLLCVILVIYLISYSIGFGALPILYMVELFPPKLKSLSSSITVSITFLIAYLITEFLPDMIIAFDVSGCYWFFCAFNVLSIVFIHFCVPETKSKSMIEIQEILN